MKRIDKNWLEWTVFAISTLLVAATIGYLIYDSVTAGDRPAEVEVRLGAPRPSPGQFLVPVTAINHGDRTAEGVHIVVTLERNGEEFETAEYDIMFLPRESSREAWVTFRNDPRTGTLRGRAVGYEEP